MKPTMTLLVVALVASFATAGDCPNCARATTVVAPPASAPAITYRAPAPTIQRETIIERTVVPAPVIQRETIIEREVPVAPAATLYRSQAQAYDTSGCASMARDVGVGYGTSYGVSRGFAARSYSYGASTAFVPAREIVFQKRHVGRAVLLAPTSAAVIDVRHRVGPIRGLGRAIFGPRAPVVVDAPGAARVIVR